MSPIYALLYSMAATAVGLALPGMLNMTAVRIRLQRGYIAARQFVFGTAFTTSIQAMIAIVFANVLMANPSIIEGFRLVAVGVFLALGIFFLLKNSATPMAEAKPISKRRSFFGGVLLGFMNFLSIPYLLAAGTWGLANHYMEPTWSHRFIFMGGAGIGSLLVNFGYVKSATWVERKINFIARNINRILGVFFLVLTVWQAWVVWG
ncbi:MAG: hypothetical protein AAFY36_07500 [Bacteroidota bacterium]